MHNHLLKESTFKIKKEEFALPISNYKKNNLTNLKNLNNHSNRMGKIQKIIYIIKISMRIKIKIITMDLMTIIFMS
jgi:hypothetical protein